MVTATDFMKEALRKKVPTNREEIDKLVEACVKKTGKGSTGLFYKVKNKLIAQGELGKAITEAGEPVVRVDEEAEVIEEEVPEEAEFEPPTEEEEREAPAEEVPAEVIEEEEAEEERRLREIGGRALARLFDVAIEDVLNLEKAGLSRQESDDTHFLALLMIAKYLKVEVKEYMLEVTSGLHFGSIGLRLLVKWIKKKRAEKKREEEKPVKKVEPEFPTGTTEKPAEEETEEEAVEETPAEEEAREDREVRGADGLTPSERKYKRKVTGGM